MRGISCSCGTTTRRTDVHHIPASRWPRSGAGHIKPKDAEVWAAEALASQLATKAAVEGEHPRRGKRHDHYCCLLIGFVCGYGVGEWITTSRSMAGFRPSVWKSTRQKRFSTFIESPRISALSRSVTARQIFPIFCFRVAPARLEAISSVLQHCPFRLSQQKARVSPWILRSAQSSDDATLAFAID